MLNNLMLDEGQDGEMRRRVITLPDGRYMILYTFGETPPPARDASETTAEPSGSDTQPEAKEVRDV